MDKILFSITILLFVPLITSAQNAGFWATPFLGSVYFLASRLITLFVAIIVLVFVWGLVVFIKNTDNENKVAEGKKLMIWGVVGLFVVFGVWGFVEILQDVTGLGSSSVQTAPTVTNPL